MAIMWPSEGADTELWPLAVNYAVYLWNRTPNIKHGYAPLELFCGTSLNCENISKARVFGCPSYVLHPKLQDGKKIPKWQPRSRRGQFMGMSEDHACTIGLIRNLQSGYISPQFHVVYDELFQTIARSDNAIDRNLWLELIRTSREYYLEEGDFGPELTPDWDTNYDSE